LFAESVSPVTYTLAAASTAIPSPASNPFRQVGGKNEVVPLRSQFGDEGIRRADTFELPGNGFARRNAVEEVSPVTYTNWLESTAMARTESSSPPPRYVE